MNRGLEINELHEITLQFGPDNSMAVQCLLNTAGMLLAGWLAYTACPVWLLLLPIASIYVRIFTIYHDACHGSFFTHSSWNRRLANSVWIFGGCSGDAFRDPHAMHHAVLGSHLDDSLTIHKTVDEFNSMRHRTMYRVFRDPFVFFTLVGALMGCIILAKPNKSMKNAAAWLSCHCIHVALIGWPHSLLLHTFSGMMGLMLFHLQHQANDPYRTKDKPDKMKQGINGSTWLHVPRLLEWITLGIEYHHIHHISTRVPGHRLKECHNSKPGEFWMKAGVNHLCGINIIQALANTLYEDKTYQRFTSFWPYNLYTH
jgi:omega-6 fatty acid desaturase (delta-12 desaturase)